jgi:hypothetical protein
VVCLQIMTSWDSTKVPIYKLVQRPEAELLNSTGSLRLSVPPQLE